MNEPDLLEENKQVQKKIQDIMSASYILLFYLSFYFVSVDLY